MQRLLFIALCSALLAGFAVGEEPRLRTGSRPNQTTKPEAVANPQLPPFEFPEAEVLPAFEAAPQVPVPRYRPIPLAGGSNADASEARTKSSSLSITTILTALTVVVLLLLGVAKLFAKRNPFMAPGIPREAIDVLGRRTIDPRSAIYVVRVGAKVLLLGSSTNGLTTLSEINDPIEVATLSSLCRGDESVRPTFSEWCLSLIGRKSQRDTRTFAERFGESLFQEAERDGQPVTRVTIRPTREGQHVA